MITILSFLAFFFLGSLVIGAFDIVIQLVFLLVTAISLLFSRKKS